MMRNSIKLLAAVLVLLASTSCKKESVDGDLGRDVERISLLLDYESGYGGYVYPVYNPYVFFKNGTVVKEPKIPIEELNLDALTTEQAYQWGTWVANGDKVTITYSDGDNTEKDWPGQEAYPPAKGDKQHGSFSSISGGGDLAFGGDIGVLNYSSMSFTDDGWYTTESVGGANSSNLAVYHTETTSGRYTFDGGYQITLTANNGQIKHFFFCWYDADREGVFRLGGRTFTEDDE